MLFTIFSVFYVLIAAAMIVLILMQRGDGANAGASFGGGASGTVFGARGSASFLTRATAVLASLFFLLSLGMGIYLSGHGMRPTPSQALGVMAGVGSSAPAASASVAGAVPASSVVIPQSEVPAAPESGKAKGAEVPTPPASGSAANPAVPVAPAKSPAPSAPASSGKGR